VHAGQVPFAASAPERAITAQDRLYLSAQSSNAISVIDPSTNTLLGVIKLGGRLEETLAAVYRGQSLVHGMGFSPDSSTLAAVAVASNAVVFVHTTNNTVKHVQYVGRAPHEVMWTPDGRCAVLVLKSQRLGTYVQGLHPSSEVVLQADSCVFFTCREVWVAIRGEDFIQVLDATTYKPTRQIKVRSNSW
jgi:hypothetical protein